VDVVEVAPGVHHALARHASWVLVTDGADVTLIDSGFPGDRQRITASLEMIGRSAADISAILLTHAHPDHVGTAEYLRRTHGTPVWVHEREEANARGERIEQIAPTRILRMMWRPDVLLWVIAAIGRNAAHPERLRAVHTFTEGALDIPGRPDAVFTPGHTSGHACFHLAERGALIAGDALVTAHAVAGRPSGPQLLPDPFNADAVHARASLQRLRRLAADVVVPGHGPAFRGSPELAVSQALARSA
jgi:glyoxylase-like metal-dependent hydrolase (beta-lactamase superfamily II)